MIKTTPNGIFGGLYYQPSSMTLAKLNEPFLPMSILWTPQSLK